MIKPVETINGYTYISIIWLSTTPNGPFLFAFEGG